MSTFCKIEKAEKGDIANFENRGIFPNSENHAVGRANSEKIVTPVTREANFARGQR